MPAEQDLYVVWMLSELRLRLLPISERTQPVRGFVSFAKQLLVAVTSLYINGFIAFSCLHILTLASRRTNSFSQMLAESLVQPPHDKKKSAQKKDMKCLHRMSYNSSIQLIRTAAHLFLLLFSAQFSFFPINAATFEYFSVKKTNKHLFKG